MDIVYKNIDRSNDFFSSNMTSHSNFHFEERYKQLSIDQNESLESFIHS